MIQLFLSPIILGQRQIVELIDATISLTFTRLDLYENLTRPIEVNSTEQPSKQFYVCTVREGDTIILTTRVVPYEDLLRNKYSQSLLLDSDLIESPDTRSYLIESSEFAKIDNIREYLEGLRD